jgi:ADP-ribosylglycohydrolase
LDLSGYFNKVYGGWLGRVAGSHFGAPLEFRPAWYTGSRQEITGYVKRVNPAAVNDDEIYQVTGLLALENHGPRLTTRDIGEEWKKRLYRQQFTAEKVALRNLQRGIDAPACASPENGNIWFDAIGAQMKADIWGLVTPDCPGLAAEYARMDGAVAHQGVGIDGEVFIAALISQAFSGSDVQGMMNNALDLLSPESEYRQYMERVMEIQRQHPDPDQWKHARRLVLQEWNVIRRRLQRETGSFGRKAWLQIIPGLHVLPNAGIIVLSLLYAQADMDPFGRALCLGGMMGLDADCNCGNIGTFMGTLLGAERLPGKWIEPLQDTFRTYVRGYEEWKISELAKRICAMGERIISEIATNKA